jgi:nucleotide-binding universal stress UspA family protein
LKNASKGRNAFFRPTGGCYYAGVQIHPRRILWPTDLSPLSIKGGQYARAFCKVFSARLHVIHVAPVLVWSDAMIPMMTGGDSLVTRTDTVTPAKQALGHFLEKQFGKGLDVRTDVRSGNAWYEICRYAKHEAIDLIVIATHGLTGVRHLLIGSTAERVVQHASCPVMTVKSFERDFLAGAGKRRKTAAPKRRRL